MKFSQNLSAGAIGLCLSVLASAACGDDAQGMSQYPAAVSGRGATLAGAPGLTPPAGTAGAPAFGAAGAAAGPIATPAAGSGGRGAGPATSGRGAIGPVGSGASGIGAAGIGGRATGSAGAAGSVGAAGTAGGPPAAGSGSGDGYDPCPPAGMPCKILPFGDSITFGLGFAGGYRVELFNKAVAAGKQITFLGSQMNGPAMVAGKTFPTKNEGHSGWKINQLLPLIPDPAFMGDPDIVLLMIGTNDIAQNDNLASAPMRLGALIDKITTSDPQALVVVATITPLSFGSASVGPFNDTIPALVKERATAGKHVIMVDQFTGFPTSELGDGVHPNEMGYSRMAGVWYAAIGDLLH